MRRESDKASGPDHDEQVERSPVHGEVQSRVAISPLRQLSGRFQSYGEVNRGKSIEQVLAEDSAAFERAMDEDWRRTSGNF